MSDYNDGLLPEPCLRMDTHFGDEYESVEFGDGTGYVKAEPTLARLGALHTELDELREQGARLFDKTLELGTENSKLRELCKKLYLLADESYVPFKDVNPWMNEFDNAIRAMRELGIEVDG